MVGKMADIVCDIYIFHLSRLMSLHCLVKGGCSKFLPNTGFVTIRLLRFGDKVKKATFRDNFLAQRKLPDTRSLSGDDFLCFNRMAPIGASAYDAVTFLERERCEKRVVVRRLCPCTGAHFEQ